mgnify:CR=1 FL=1
MTFLIDNINAPWYRRDLVFRTRWGVLFIGGQSWPPVKFYPIK